MLRPRVKILEETLRYRDVVISDLRINAVDGDRQTEPTVKRAARRVLRGVKCRIGRLRPGR
jgi:hypothetical protein